MAQTQHVVYHGGRRQQTARTFVFSLRRERLAGAQLRASPLPPPNTSVQAQAIGAQSGRCLPSALSRTRAARPSACPPRSLVGSKGTRGRTRFADGKASSIYEKKQRLWVSLAAEPVATGTNQAQGRLGLGGQRPGRVCCLTSSGISAGLSPAPVSPRHISCGAGRAQV